MQWPYIEGDFMEVGETGWVAIGENKYVNLRTGHTIEEDGKEYDQNGVLVDEHDTE